MKARIDKYKYKLGRKGKLLVVSLGSKRGIDGTLFVHNVLCPKYCKKVIIEVTK